MAKTLYGTFLDCCRDEGTPRTCCQSGATWPDWSVGFRVSIPVGVISCACYTPHDPGGTHDGAWQPAPDCFGTTRWWANTPYIGFMSLFMVLEARLDDSGPTVRLSGYHCTPANQSDIDNVCLGKGSADWVLTWHAPALIPPWRCDEQSGVTLNYSSYVQYAALCVPSAYQATMVSLTLL